MGILSTLQILTYYNYDVIVNHKSNVQSLQRVILQLYDLELTPQNPQKPVQTSRLPLAGTLKERFLKFRPFLNDSLLSTCLKTPVFRTPKEIPEKAYGHQKIMLPFDREQVICKCPLREEIGPGLHFQRELMEH